MIKPEIALLGGAVLSPSIPIMTIQRGKIAPMIEPRPAEIYFTPQVLKPLLKTKLRTESTRSGNRSFFSGRGYFLMIKYNKYKLPPRNCLIPAIWRAGIYLTPSFETTHVVPHTILTIPKARIAKKSDPFNLNLFGKMIENPLKASVSNRCFIFLNFFKSLIYGIKVNFVFKKLVVSVTNWKNRRHTLILKINWFAKI